MTQGPPAPSHLPSIPVSLTNKNINELLMNSSLCLKGKLQCLANELLIKYFLSLCLYFRTPQYHAHTNKMPGYLVISLNHFHKYLL